MHLVHVRGKAHSLRAGPVEGSAAQGRPEGHARHVPHVGRHVAAGLDDRALDVFQALQEAEAADHVLDAVDLDRARSHVQVRAPDRSKDLLQGHAVGSHGVGIDVDLHLAHEAAHRGHLRHAARRGQGVAHGPVLDRAQLVEVPAARRAPGLVPSLEGVPEDLTEGRRVRAEGRGDLRRQGVGGEAGELLEHARAGGVELGLVLEDDVDRGEAEVGVAADRAHVGDAEQRDRQGVGDLVLDVLGRAARPAREDDLLVLADVGDRVDRDRVAGEAADRPVEGRRPQAPADHEERDQDDDGRVLEAKTDPARERSAGRFGGAHRRPPRAALSSPVTLPQRSIAAP